MGTKKLPSTLLLEENTTYWLCENYDLKEATLNIPEGVTLIFRGGSISNGIIDFNNCYIKADPSKCIFPGIISKGHLFNDDIYSAWFEGEVEEKKQKEVEEEKERDSDHIQQAINAALLHDYLNEKENESEEEKRTKKGSAERTKKTIYLTPEKKYKITKSIHLYQGISIDGRYATVSPKGFSDFIIKQNISTENNMLIDWTYIYGEIKNIHFDNSGRDGTVSTPNEAKGIRFAGYVNINNLVFNNFTNEIESFSNYNDGITIDTITIPWHKGDAPVVSIYQGDRTRINGINALPCATIHIGQCHGGEIANCVNVGVIAENCNSLSVSNMHVENPLAYFSFKGTVATLSDCILYESNTKDAYPISVKSDQHNNASTVTVNNVGIYRDFNFNLENFNDFECDKKSTVIFNMCYVNYQRLVAGGFEGTFMAPTINGKYEETANTLNGIYIAGKFSKFTRKLIVESKKMIASVNETPEIIDEETQTPHPDYKKGQFSKTGGYEYYVIPLVSGSRHIGFEQGSERKLLNISDLRSTVNIKFLYWGDNVNVNFTNNIIRLCRRHIETNTTQYVDFISLGQQSSPIIDYGNKVKNIGEWKDLNDIKILEGYECEVGENITAKVKNINNINQLPTASFKNGDVLLSDNGDTYYFRNGKWEVSREYKGIVSDYLSTEVSNWARCFSLKVNTNSWERKTIVFSVSSAYHAGSENGTVTIAIPYGGTNSPYIVNSGKNYTGQIKLAYMYESEKLHIYINAGSYKCYSIKMLQSDIPSDQYTMGVSQVSLPTNAKEFGTV